MAIFDDVTAYSPPSRCAIGPDGAFYLNGAAFYNDAGADISGSLESLNSVAPAELAFIDGVTAGTATADKAVVLDASKGIATITSATITTLTSTTGNVTTVNATNVDAGASGTAGSVDVFPSTASKGKIAITCTDQTGDTTVSLVAGAMAAARTITIRDPGAAASLLTTTDATAAAVAATAVEIARTCDVSARAVLAGSTLAVTEALHDGKTIQFDQLAGSVCTLPAASGSGARFRFATFVLATSNSHIVKVANGTDIMVGAISVSDAADDSLTLFSTTATSDTITLNRTTTGSVRIGEMIELEDIKTGFWAVRGHLIGTGGEATPFSATV